jgi:hypothetical protein
VVATPSTTLAIGAFPQGVVSTQGTGAGSEQVTEASEPDESKGVSSGSDAKAGDLGETSRHIGGLGVVPIA